MQKSKSCPELCNSSSHFLIKLPKSPVQKLKTQAQAQAQADLQYPTQFPTDLVEQVELYSSLRTTLVNVLLCGAETAPDLEASSMCLATPTEEATIECHDIPPGRWTIWSRRFKKYKKHSKKKQDSV